MRLKHNRENHVINYDRYTAPVAASTLPVDEEQLGTALPEFNFTFDDLASSKAASLRWFRQSIKQKNFSIEPDLEKIIPYLPAMFITYITDSACESNDMPTKGKKRLTDTMVLKALQQFGYGNIAARVQNMLDRQDHDKKAPSTEDVDVEKVAVNFEHMNM